MKRSLMTVATVVGLGFTYGWSTAAYAVYDPSAVGITTTSGCSAPGGFLTVDGINFEPSESITLTLRGTQATLGTPTASSASSPSPGTFSTKVTIPSDTKQGASYTIVATGVSGDSASTVITIARTCAAGSGLAFTGEADSGLASGADIAALSSVGAVALALGGMLILTSRRRRTARD
jgi:hypothetical protein